MTGKHICTKCTPCLFIVSLYCCNLFFVYIKTTKKEKRDTTLLSLRLFCKFMLKKRLLLNATTYTPVELLGPCFKTGRIVASENILKKMHT